MLPNEKLVTAAVKRHFGERTAQAKAILDRYGRNPDERDRAVVQMAILKLSEGDLEKLRDLVEVARQNYRDVLHWAEEARKPRLP